MRAVFQVKHLITSSTAASTDDVFSESRTVLNSAASSGGGGVFEAVLAEVERYWPAWRVRYLKSILLYRKYDKIFDSFCPVPTDVHACFEAVGGCAMTLIDVRNLPKILVYTCPPGGGVI